MCWRERSRAGGESQPQRATGKSLEEDRSQSLGVLALCEFSEPNVIAYDVSARNFGARVGEGSRFGGSGPSWKGLPRLPRRGRVPLRQPAPSTTRPPQERWRPPTDVLRDQEDPSPCVPAGEPYATINLSAKRRAWKNATPCRAGRLLSEEKRWPKATEPKGLSGEATERAGRPECRRSCQAAAQPKETSLGGPEPVC